LKFSKWSLFPLFGGGGETFLLARLGDGLILVITIFRYPVSGDAL